MRSSSALILLVFISLSLLLSGCCFIPWGTPEPRELVPSSASSVLDVKVSVVLSDPDLREVYRTAFPGQDIDDEFQPIRDIGGIDPRDAEEAVFFSLAGGGKSKSAAIVKGPFNKNAVESSLSSNPSWARSDYYGHAFYNSSGVDGPLSAAFAGDYLVLGGEQAVKAVIDVEGGAPSVSENARISRVLSQLPSDSVLVFAKEVREEDRSSLTPGFPLNATDAFSSVRASGLSVQKQGSAITLRGVMGYGSQADALRGKAVLDAGIIFLSTFSAPESSTHSLLSKVQTTNENELVFIDLANTNLQELNAAKNELDAQARETP